MAEQLEQARIFSAASSFRIFEIEKYHQNEPTFKGVYSINNLSKKKDRVFEINFDEFKSIGTQWIALHVNGNNIIYFDTFRDERIPN